MTDSVLQDNMIVVVKVGTSSVMRVSSGSRIESLSDQASSKLGVGQSEVSISSVGLLVDTLITLRRANFDVILVTSGGVGVGCREMNVSRRPTISCGATHHDRARVSASIRAFAAIGQSLLMQTYHSLFSMASQKIAQVLLTSHDLESQFQLDSFKNTILYLLSIGVIPVINENDTMTTENLKYGDNDWISAIMAATMGASWLFLLTDVDHLYSGNPRTDANAKPISVVENIETMQAALDGTNNATGTQWGTGGMETKITAARLATAAGVRVCLVHGQHPSRMLNFVQDRGVKMGTVFEPLSTTPLSQQRKKWIAICLPTRGEVVISDNAAVRLRTRHPLTVNEVVGCDGIFVRNSAVSIRTVSGLEVGRGICNYSSIEMTQFVNQDEVLDEAEKSSMHIAVLEENLGLLVNTNIDYSDNAGDGGTEAMADFE